MTAKRMPKGSEFASRGGKNPSVNPRGGGRQKKTGIGDPQVARGTCESAGFLVGKGKSIDTKVSRRKRVTNIEKRQGSTLERVERGPPAV